MFVYDTTNDNGYITPHRDEIFANAADGTLCAQYPTISAAAGTPSMLTTNCNNNADTSTTKAVCTGKSTKTDEKATSEEGKSEAIYSIEMISYLSYSLCFFCRRCINIL
jgi:hypothetical protein